MEGATLQLQIQAGGITDARAVAEVRDLLRWDEFSRGNARGLLIASCQQLGQRRYFAIDSRDAWRRAARHGTTSVPIPEAYELDDLTFALLWANASLDTGLQVDEQELAITIGELAPYGEMTSSAVSREAAPDLGTTAQMWLGSDFCARHILRNYEHLTEIPVFWTREQTGSEGSPWLLFEHKHAYLRATRDHFNDAALSRMFCIPRRAVATSPVYERILLLLSIALMEATGIHVKVCDDPAFSEVEGFVLSGHNQAIIANWVRGEGIWHVDTARRASVLSDLDHGRRQGVPQVQHGDLLPRRDVAGLEPAAVQRGHGDAPQFGLGDIQAQVGADVDQPPGLAGQQVTGVVASVEEARLAGRFLPPLPTRGSRGRDCWLCCRACRGQDPQVAAQLVAGDQAGVFHRAGQRVVRPGDQVRALAGVLDVGRCVPEPGRLQAGAGIIGGQRKPDHRVAERHIAAADPVVLGPLHVNGCQQARSRRVPGHQAGAGDVGADDHFRFPAEDAPASGPLCPAA